RREVPEPLRAVFLKVVIRLQEMMEPEHEAIVLRRPLAARSEDVQYAFSHPVGQLDSAGLRKPDLMAIAGENSTERLRGHPHARLTRIDVGKHAEDAVAIGRAAGKGIDVQKIVAGRCAELTRCLLQRSKAHLIQLPARCVRGYLDR